jgi:hypothetical protein
MQIIRIKCKTFLHLIGEPQRNRAPSLYDLNANDTETITVLLTSATVEIRGYFLMRLYKLLLAHKVAVVYPSSTTELVQDFPHVAGITVTKKER